MPGRDQHTLMCPQLVSALQVAAWADGADGWRADAHLRTPARFSHMHAASHTPAHTDTCRLFLSHTVSVFHLMQGLFLVVEAQRPRRNRMLCELDKLSGDERGTVIVSVQGVYPWRWRSHGFHTVEFRNEKTATTLSFPIVLLHACTHTIPAPSTEFEPKMLLVHSWDYLSKCTFIMEPSGVSSVSVRNSDRVWTPDSTNTHSAACEDDTLAGFSSFGQS